ncbi:MAG: hypothetical protein ACJ76Z_06240 [Thermoleophilaceae bacterium]
MTGAGAAPGPRLRPRALSARSWAIAGWAAGLGAAALAALAVAADAGVVGAAAAPDVVRVGLATIAVFAVCGYAPAVALTPAALMPWWPALVLPLGAIASGMALTVLGFAAVPFHFALPATLLAGVVLAVRTRSPGIDRAETSPATYAGVACVAALLVAVALIPTFRSGLATVTGFGSDAHLVAGSATFLQHNYPASTNVAYPADQVPPLWRSKFPIYYALAAVSSVAGVEPWQALMTVAAIVLALAGLGFFLLARTGFGAPIGVAAAAMAVAVLDRRVFHLALHPYYNQLWGMLTLPYTLVAAYEYALRPSRRALGLFAAFLAVGAFAYPLMLPFPLLAGAGFWLLARRERAARGEPVAPIDVRAVWRGKRSLLWIVPLALLLAIPIAGVAEKIAQAVALVWSPGNSLAGWQGDLEAYPPVGEFFAIFPSGVSALLALAVCALGFVGLARAPRTLGRPLVVVLGAAVAVAVFFRLARYGQYFYFKVLSFAAPQLLTAAVVLLGALAFRARSLYGRGIAFAALVALCASALLSARGEIQTSFDQLSPETLQLRDWAKALPPRASIRLDTPRSSQLWQAYMLSSHPLGSRDPITNYPHVPLTAEADYALDRPLLPPPADAVGPPLRRNSQLRLWRLRGSGPDTTSRRMVPIFSRNAPVQTRGG